MSDLIKALQIFLKYGDPRWPTHCEHDVLYVMIDPSIISKDDLSTLDEIGFFDNGDHFESFRFGSC
jgi:hypothetical protein